MKLIINILCYIVSNPNSLIIDRSWSFDSNHIDLYVYREKNYRTLNSEHKLSKVDVYEGGDCNLLNYA